MTSLQHLAQPDPNVVILTKLGTHSHRTLTEDIKTLTSTFTSIMKVLTTRKLGSLQREEAFSGEITMIGLLIQWF